MWQLFGKCSGRDGKMWKNVENVEKCADSPFLIYYYELVKIDKWVCANKLSLNINKTALSICSTKAVTDVRRVKIRNVEINLVNNFKFLGIIIDSNLSFSSHYQHICNKTSRSSSVLSKLACYVPQPILRKLYQTMIYPHLNYGIEIWGTRAKRE